MKIVLIEPNSDEKVIFTKTPEDKTLGELLKGHYEGVKSIEINGEFVEDWKNHKIEKKDEIKIWQEVGYGYEAIIIAIVLAIVSAVVSYLLAPKPKASKKSSAQPALGVGGITNTIAPGTPKFISYGRRKVFGHLIGSWVDVLETEALDRPDSSRFMKFSALYYMGVGQIAGMGDVKINGTHLCDIYGPPGANMRLGTQDQEIIANHELCHQTYADGRELEVPARISKRRQAPPGRPITYTTKGNQINRVTLFFQFPQGLWSLGMRAQTPYPGTVIISVRKKRNTDPEGQWGPVEQFWSITINTRNGFFWKVPIELDSTSQWDLQMWVENQNGLGSWGQTPTLILYNVMETKYITTAYPGNALLEVHGIANDQITSFDNMNCSAVVDGRLVEVYQNGLYTKQFSRNRVWIIRDILFNREVGLGNRLSSTLWDNAAGLEAADYYEESVSGFSDVSEQRDYCDVILNDQAPGWDHIKNLLFEGRASLIPISGRFRYTLNVDKTPELLYSFPANIIEKSLQLENGSNDKPINTLRADFSDVDNDYKTIPTKLNTDDIGDTPERPETFSIVSIVRESEVSRLMSYRLKTLTQIKRRWLWKSPQTAITSDPLDVSWLSYNVPQRLRGYNGFIKGNSHTTSRIIADRSVYIAPGITYTTHVRHLNTVEERTITNATGTHSIFNLATPLTFTPEDGDIWVVGKSNTQVEKVQIDDVEWDGQVFTIRAHEHIPAIYEDDLPAVTELEGGSLLDATPMPLLDAQARYFTSGGVTQGYLFNVVTSFNYLGGTYSQLTGSTITLASYEPDIDDFFNGAYLKADLDSPKIITDYDGTNKIATVTPDFLLAVSQGGIYNINWPQHAPFYEFAVEGLSGSTWSLIDTAVGTSLTVLTGSTYSSFRFTPRSAAGLSNTTGRVVVSEGIFDTTPPAIPLTLYVSSDASRLGVASNQLLLPLDRDIQYVETEFISGLTQSDAYLSSRYEVAQNRDESNTNETITVSSQVELESFPFGTSLYARSSTLDFFGNRSSWVQSFDSITLSSDADNEGQNIEEEIVTFGGLTGSTSGASRITLFTDTLDGGTIGTSNAVKLDLNVLVTPGSTTSTHLDFIYSYGGDNFSTITSYISNGSTKIDDESLYWLTLYLTPKNSNSSVQDTIARKAGPEVPTNDVRTATDVINIDSTADQTLAIYLDILGDTTTQVSVINASLKQIANPDITEPYIVAGTVPGKPSANTVVLVHPTGLDVTFATDAAGSYGYALTAAAATVSFILKKNNTEWGRMYFAPSILTASFIATTTSFSPGDVLTITSPVAQDGSLANVGWSIIGDKN